MSTLFTNFFEKINQISPLEHDFTEVLDTIALTPKTLYFRGKLPQNMSKKGNSRPKTVAIVGSRHNTRYGEDVAYRLAYELAKHHVIIISGLAYGIDSIAHKGCLAAGGKTIAVLGTPINRIYPVNHKTLAKQIIEQNGAIISEYAPRTKEYYSSPLAPGEYYDDMGRRTQEPKNVVVVVEAAEKSGSLNTATHALEQGKEVFAVPGNITSPYSQGCNKLIKQGATPYTCPDDILQLLFPEEYIKKHKRLKTNNLIGDTDVETLILQAIAKGLSSGEEIMQNTKLPPEVFSQTVTLLEIKSRIRPLGMNHWGLI